RMAELRHRLPPAALPSRRVARRAGPHHGRAERAPRPGRRPAVGADGLAAGASLHRAPRPVAARVPGPRPPRPLPEHLAARAARGRAAGPARGHAARGDASDRDARALRGEVQAERRGRHVRGAREGGAALPGRPLQPAAPRARASLRALVLAPLDGGRRRLRRAAGRFGRGAQLPPRRRDEDGDPDPIGGAAPNEPAGTPTAAAAYFLSETPEVWR